MPVGETEAYHHDEAKEDEPKFPHIYGPVSSLPLSPPPRDVHMQMKVLGVDQMSLDVLRWLVVDWCGSAHLRDALSICRGDLDADH